MGTRARLPPFGSEGFYCGPDCGPAWEYLLAPPLLFLNTGALDGGSPCRMSSIKYGNVAMSNLRKGRVAMSILRKYHVTLSILRKGHVACR